MLRKTTLTIAARLNSIKPSIRLYTTNKSEWNESERSSLVKKGFTEKDIKAVANLYSVFSRMNDHDDGYGLPSMRHEDILALCVRQIESSKQKNLKLHNMNIEIFLINGIDCYQENKFVNAYKFLNPVIRSEEAKMADKAIAYLYLAKCLMLGSSKSERLAIENLEKSKLFFEKSGQLTEKYELHYADLQNEFKKINDLHGSIDKYKSNIETRLDEIGIEYRSALRK